MRRRRRRNRRRKGVRLLLLRRWVCVCKPARARVKEARVLSVRGWRSLRAPKKLCANVRAGVVAAAEPGCLPSPARI
jgi:hypothetical protein